MEEPETIEVPDSDTTCSICYAEFLEPEDLTMHINQMHPNEMHASLLKCHFCPRSCTDLEAYAIHLRDMHLCDLRCCKYCMRVFDHYIAYKRHEQSHLKHWDKTKYLCSNCKNVFATIAELEVHEFQNHSDSTDGIFLRDVLPILSSLLNIKVTRFLQSLGEKGLLYVCVNCGHTTPEVTDYIEHLTKKECRSLACDRCLSVYRYRKGLQRHFASHPECYHGGDIVMQCSECHQEFDRQTYKQHTKACKVIKCKTCEIVFDSMYDLTKHQSESHPAVVQLQACKYCNKDFAGDVALEKHIQRSHKDHFHLYKYRCIYCDVVFKHPKKLFGHFFSTHKDIDPYTCKICDKKFRIRKSFTLHIKLDHKSIGFVEFDDRFHVFFSAQRSENPFNPSALTSAETEATEQNDNENLLVERKKVHFNVKEKSDGNNDVNLVNVNSDFMSATETEGNQTEGEIDKTASLKRKRTNRNKRKRVATIDEVVLSDSSDEDEPLLQVKKRVTRFQRSRLAVASRTRNLKHFKSRGKGSKNRFICDICNKQCYTFQNYNNHIALHKNKAKCVKCSKVCKSKKALNEHYAREHATSQLTETLKNILAKRKTLSKQPTAPVEISSHEKFRLTIKKVSMPKSNVVATITPVGDKPLSVQKFIESFTPETENSKKDINIDSNISVKKVTGIPKKPFIKMTKCNLDPLKNFSAKKLALPVRFKPCNEQHKITVKVVTPVTRMTDETEENKYNVESFDHQFDHQDSYADEEVDQDTEQIPEVAQEVMLEGSEEPAPKTIYIPHKVVIPKLPKNCKKIHIAHLQPEAPYYKIVNINDALTDKKKTEPGQQQPKRDIKLPDGTTLVSVNPLAHLLGDTPVEKILESTKNKHYQPKSKDFETAVAKAMLKLKSSGDSTPSPKRRKKTKPDQV